MIRSTVNCTTISCLRGWSCQGKTSIQNKRLIGSQWWCKFSKHKLPKSNFIRLGPSPFLANNRLRRSTGLINQLIRTRRWRKLIPSLLRGIPLSPRNRRREKSITESQERCLQKNTKSQRKAQDTSRLWCIKTLRAKAAVLMMNKSKRLTLIRALTCKTTGQIQLSIISAGHVPMKTKTFIVRSYAS